MADVYKVVAAGDGGMKVTGPSQYHAPLNIYARDGHQAETIAYAMNQAYAAGLADATVAGKNV